MTRYSGNVIGQFSGRGLKDRVGLAKGEAYEVPSQFGTTEETGTRHTGDALFDDQLACEFSVREVGERREIAQDVVRALGTYGFEAGAVQTVPQQLSPPAIVGGESMDRSRVSVGSPAVFPSTTTAPGSGVMMLVTTVDVNVKYSTPSLTIL